MSLRKKINEQFNFALKSKNKALVSTLRLVLTGIKERDIANRTSEKKEPVKEKPKPKPKAKPEAKAKPKPMTLEQRRKKINDIIEEIREENNL